MEDLLVELKYTDMRIIENACELLEINPNKVYKEINYKEYVSMNELIELLDNIIYKYNYLEEKMEEIENGKEA